MDNSRRRKVGLNITKTLSILFLAIPVCSANGKDIPTTVISYGSSSEISNFNLSPHHRDIKVYMSPNGDAHAVVFHPGEIPTVIVARKVSNETSWETTQTFDLLHGDMHLYLVPYTNGEKIWLSVAVPGGGDLYLSENFGSSYAYKGKIKGNLLGFHEPQVFCNSPTDCLAIINAYDARRSATTYYSHWNGSVWCSYDAYNLYSPTLNVSVFGTVIPTESPGKYNVVRLNNVRGIADLNNPHDLTFSGHVIQQDVQDPNKCLQPQPPTTINPNIGNAQGHGILGCPTPDVDPLFADLISASVAKNDLGDFWIVWSYGPNADYTDINIKLRHWNNTTGLFDRDKLYGVNSNSVAYNFANLVYDSYDQKFYLFYQKIRKNGCKIDGEKKDCEDLCYRTVSSTGLEWGTEDDEATEFCPVKNVIVKQPEDCSDDVTPHGNNSYTGSVANGEIAMIYQDACHDGICSVYMWRNNTQ